ncbi:hypothetical protein ZHAS_00005841 [Anopheles sinensis]|uniref:Uncharacterized protein n=1 Tax=Anopheles sinensis TaxID=74873 RepID=A0A084VKR8_ANOSI|nr:hypothetical protein ZHAS_00005841 [Anopheles sinensis]
MHLNDRKLTYSVVRKVFVPVHILHTARCPSKKHASFPVALVSFRKISQRTRTVPDGTHTTNNASSVSGRINKPLAVLRNHLPSALTRDFQTKVPCPSEAGKRSLPTGATTGSVVATVESSTGTMMCNRQPYGFRELHQIHRSVRRKLIGSPSRTEPSEEAFIFG